MDCIIPSAVIVSLLFIAVISFKTTMTGVLFSQTNNVNKGSTCKNRIMIRQLNAANSILGERRMASFCKSLGLISNNRILL